MGIHNNTMYGHVRAYVFSFTCARFNLPMHPSQKFRNTLQITSMPKEPTVNIVQPLKFINQDNNMNMKIGNFICFNGYYTYEMLNPKVINTCKRVSKLSK